MKAKQTILWLIQSNQVTPTIVSFLETFQKRVEQYVDLLFVVPDSSSDILQRIASLHPRSFKVTTMVATSSYQAYTAKQEALAQRCFTDGLSIADTLLLDDLGGGYARQAIFELVPEKQTCGLILQIPSPLGSSDTEEKVFHSAILWAKENKIPAIGYELLPLDTRWTLAPALPDGVITRYPESFEHLKENLSHNNVWLLPRYEASIFSSVSDKFNLNGARASYHYKNKHAIPGNRTVLYIPHNVAMIHEYHELVKFLEPLGSHLHLMIGIGMDQIRGAYSQEESVKLIYQKELASFASHSFHNQANPWEMMMADAVVACSACFSTQTAERELPCIIYEPPLSPMTRGNKKRVTTEKQLTEVIQEIIALQKNKAELADILMFLTQTGKTNA